MAHRPAIRVALVGCGAVSQRYYAPALQELARHRLLQVTALCDPEPRNVARLEQSFPGARGAADTAELTAEKSDLAIVASPPQYHAEQTVALLQSGLSVLCEKPMATTVSEAQAMVDAAATARGILAIGMFRRFFPATQTIHRIVSLGLLGDLTELSFTEGGPFRWPVQSPSYFKRVTANGGVLMDIGVHVLDLLVWWFGEPESIRYEDDAMSGIEANCRLDCRFSSGLVGEIRLSRDCELANQYVIRGTRGWLSWDANDAEHLRMGFTDTALALNATVHVLDTVRPAPALGPRAHTFQQSFMAQIRNVVAAMQGEEALLVPGEQGIRGMHLIEACYGRRTLMAMPWLGLNEQRRAEQLNQPHGLANGDLLGEQDLSRQ